MKKSNYIIDYNSAKGKYYLFHTRYGSIVSVDSNKKTQLLQILQEPDLYNQIKGYETLCKFGFLIPSETNEFQNVYGRQILKNYCRNNYLELTIMPTEQCNFRCVYCYENFEKTIMSEFVQEAIIRFVKRELANHKGLSVGWFGGEPLLAMAVIERLSEQFIEICRQLKKPYISSMTTNGYLLNEEVFERLQKLHVNHFQITIDGDRKTHDNQRVLRGGAPTYEQIMSNLNDIQCNAKGKLWSISLRTNVTKNTIQNVDTFKKEIIAPFNADSRFYIMLRKMWTNDTSEADSLLCTDEEFESFLEQCEIGKDSLYQDYQFAHDLNFICYAANPNSLIFGSDGTIYKCTVALYDDINQIGRIQKDGNIFIDEEKMCYWIAPRAGKTEDCLTCANYAACVSRCCPYKQDRPCEMQTLEMLKYYIPQFYYLSNQSADLSADI